MGERRNSRTGLETRDRIIDAVLETVSTEGLIGTSARVIAKTGGFNQALVFYHFGSVEELLLAALERANERRMVRFREQLESVDDLQGLVQVAIELHRSAEEDRDHAALSAIIAGWSGKSEVGPRIVKILRPWDDLVSAALKRCLADTPFAQVVPTDDLAHAISAMFLGIEMLNRLDPDDTRVDSLLLSLSGAANLATPLLRSLVPKDGSGASID